VREDPRQYYSPPHNNTPSITSLRVWLARAMTPYRYVSSSSADASQSGLGLRVVTTLQSRRSDTCDRNRRCEIGSPDYRARYSALPVNKLAPSSLRARPRVSASSGAASAPQCSYRHGIQHWRERVQDNKHPALLSRTSLTFLRQRRCCCAAGPAGDFERHNLLHSSPISRQTRDGGYPHRPAATSAS